MCVQEMFAGGWYKAFQQCVYTTSTGVVLQCFHKVFIHFAKLVHNLYKCFLQCFYILCTSVFDFLQHLYMWFWKVFTAVLQVFVWKAFTIYVHVCLRGVCNGCTSVFWKASTTSAQVLCAQLLHKLYKCFCKVWQQLYIGFERLHNMRTSFSQGF
jgi:hypothetical protein